jgi:hypothetical protein
VPGSVVLPAIRLDLGGADAALARLMVFGGAREEGRVSTVHVPGRPLGLSVVDRFTAHGHTVSWGGLHSYVRRYAAGCEEPRRREDRRTYRHAPGAKVVSIVHALTEKLWWSCPSGAHQ